MKNKTRINLTGWAVMSPALIVFMTLVIVPIVASLLLSFTKWNFLSGLEGIEWIGLDNFDRLFNRDRKFTRAISNTISYALVTTPVSIFLALLLAYFLNDKVWFKKVNRTFFFIPYISSLVALAAVFRFLFRSDGPINMILQTIGIANPPNWFGNGEWARIPVMAVMIYAGVGFCLIVYMAALQGVPKDLYEAAKIDGASGFVTFCKITFPLISPTTFYLLVVRFIASFKAFSAINTMDMSLKTPTLVTEIYIQAFQNYKFGYASAEAWVLVVMIMIVTIFQMWGQKKWVHY